MASNPLHSHRRGLLKKAGVALLWACCFGGLFGAAVSFRVDRKDLLVDDPPWHVVLRGWLERFELTSYDWRSRELAALAERTDDVVLVSVDEETLQNAREDEHVEWGANPWSRELSFKVATQAAREGAAVVYFGSRVSDTSSRSAPAARFDPKRSDDLAAAAVAARSPAPIVLPFDWSSQRTRPAERPLAPFLVRVAEANDAQGAIGEVRDVLMLRARAWLVPDAGKVVLWAGASSEAKARELAQRLDVKGPLALRNLTPADEAYDVDRSWLVRQLDAVQVSGLDPSALPEARTIEAPVPELLVKTAAPAAAALVPDADGLVRAVPLLVRAIDADGKATVLATATLRLLMLAQGATRLSYADGVLHLGGELALPMERDGTVLLPFSNDESGRGGRGLFKRVIPAWRLLVNADDDEQGRGLRHHDNELAGRIVIYVDERDAERSVRTPVGRMSRGALFGQAAARLLHRTTITRAPASTDAWLTVVFAFVGATLAMAWSLVVRRPGWLAWVATIVLMVVLQAMAARQIFVEQHRWVAMAAPLLAAALTFLASLGYARALEQGLREFMVRALGGAVRADVFQRVERNLLLMRPERKALTVYVSDVEGFTGIAGEKDPATVGKVLQEFLTEMTELVLDRGGHVDKYLGDGMILFWGAPVETAEHPQLACEAALDLLERFEERRPAWEKALGKPITLRAGLDTGPAVVGELGTLHRVNYTVLGEPVATAFRLETLAGRYGARILATQSVVDGVKGGFVFRELDRVRFPRSQTPRHLWELVGRKGDPSISTERLEAWAGALAAYRERRFSEAKAAFQALDAEAKDAAAILYVRRCDTALAAPPPEDWDGTGLD